MLNPMKKRPRGMPPKGMEWDEEDGAYVPIKLSEFERQRLENIAENARRLEALGLVKFVPEKETRGQKRPRVVKEHQSCTVTMRDRTVKSYVEVRVHGEDFRSEAARRKRERKIAERNEERQRKAEREAANANGVRQSKEEQRA